MLCNQAYRFELKPEVNQRILLAKHAGCARFAYNWALAKRIELFETKEGKERFTTAIEQQRVLNRLKSSEFPWMYEVSKCAPQEALRDLQRAFDNCWRARKSGKALGFPKFKRKGTRDSFRLAGTIKARGDTVQLPRLGEIRTKEVTHKLKGRILSATVSCEADRWFVSFAVNRERVEPTPVIGEAIGIDVGLDAFATLSNGDKREAPKPLRNNLKRLKRLSKKHSRKQKGSNHRQKSAFGLARVHRSIRNKRCDFLHKLATELTKTKSVIIVEDLKVKGMVRNWRLSQSMTDIGWGAFRRMLEYKSKWYGSTLAIAPRFYRSTKMCSVCSHVVDVLALSVWRWACPSCQAAHDRDVNAAKSLLKIYTGSSPEIDACGDPSGGESGATAF